MSSTLADRLVTLMFSTSRLIRERSRDKNLPTHLTIVHVEALRYIKDHSEASMKDLAAYLCITPPSVTPLIDVLVKMDLVRRSADAKDRRLILLRLTTKGDKLLVRGFRIISARLRRVFSRLTLEEQKNLVRIFEKLSKLYSK